MPWEKFIVNEIIGPVIIITLPVHVLQKYAEIRLIGGVSLFKPEKWFFKKMKTEDTYYYGYYRYNNSTARLRKAGRHM